ncbi:MAG: hypothetical protein AVO34_06325 [Firmicutes bacterium ML8_F2]|nr:MAG: hypothetical protein AVO34_06325 [Firmicutes bacterium ML8_F2]
MILITIQMRVLLKTQSGKQEIKRLPYGGLFLFQQPPLPGNIIIGAGCRFIPKPGLYMPCKTGLSCLKHWI